MALRMHRSAGMNYVKREELWGYILITPFLLLFLIFVLAPTLLGIVMSVLEWYDRRPVYVGFTNFAYVLNDQRFWTAMRNTLTYALVFTPLAIALALGVAIRLAQLRSTHVRQTLQGAFYLPGV